MDALRRMEYRGYDSAGIALVGSDGIASAKKAGKLLNLEAELDETPIPDANLGIGHTRWATHGAPSDANAHPHISSNGRVALVHNGIIENFAVLKAELQAAGVEFRSETDSEVAAHLVGREVEGGASLADAMRSPTSTFSPWLTFTDDRWQYQRVMPRPMSSTIVLPYAGW